MPRIFLTTHLAQTVSRSWPFLAMVVVAMNTLVIKLIEYYLVQLISATKDHWTRFKVISKGEEKMFVT